MASKKEYLDFILEQLSELVEITYKPMMGEYIIYYHEKIIGGIYDDRFLIKPVKAAVSAMPEAIYECPYDGAKEMLLVNNIEDKGFLKALIAAMYEELPAPKKKKQIKKKEAQKMKQRVKEAAAGIETNLASPLAKISFAEIAALGGSFAGLAQTMATPATEGLYRCVFPKGVTGTLAMKDGAYLGTIMNDGIVGQARWTPVETLVNPTSVQIALVAVAVLAVSKQVQDIKDGQKEIIGILERDKKSQLLADYDLLASYMDEYKFYWENDASLVVNLNQVKNIKRNAMKDIRSYTEQIETMLSAKKNLLRIQTASNKMGQLLDRFVHYKLALHVFALSEYMEVLLSKNFQAEYLNKIENEIREHAMKFRNLYTACFDKIELLRKDAVTTQAANRLADASRTVGSFIGKIPLVKEGPVDEFLIGVGDSISDAEKKQLEKTLTFFIQHKDSGLIPIAEHIATINQLSNKPVVMLYDKKVLCFHELKEIV